MFKLQTNLPNKTGMGLGGSCRLRPCTSGAIGFVFCMSLGAEDCAFDGGNPPDASEKANYEEKKSLDLAPFAAF